MFVLDSDTLDSLIQASRTSPRRRKNLNLHTEASDPMHRMFHAVQPDSYVRPHKHETPDKREVFVLVRGRFLILEWDGEGAILRTVVMDREMGPWAVEFPPRSWHSLIALEPDSVFFECKDGPWDAASDKNFASWAPEEGSPEAADFNRQILDQLGF